MTQARMSGGFSLISAIPIVFLLLVPVTVSGTTLERGAVDPAMGTKSLELRALPHFRALPHAREPSDTLWFGGYDEATGTAIPGGVWDFEDGTTQGWTSTDRTELPRAFRHVTEDSCQVHDDPICPLINDLGSMWVGLHENEAVAECWPGGMGYGNAWGLHLYKEFTYSGTNPVVLSFDYFVDSECDFDFTYVYVIDDQGITTPVNPNPCGRRPWGYSGSNQEGSGIGSPTDPAHGMIIIDQYALPQGSAPFEIEFNFQSDILLSDALDAWPTFLNSWYGPFGIDDIHVSGNDLDDFSDFEPTGTPGEEYDGWIVLPDPPIGSFMQVTALDDLDEMSVTCQCPLTQSQNDYVMVAADISPFPPNFPHPNGQHEWIQSPPAYVGEITGTDRFVIWSVYEDYVFWDPGAQVGSGVGYWVTADYYPWTCPETGVVGWTVEPAGEKYRGWGSVWGRPEYCGTDTFSVSLHIPAEVDSLRVVFQLLGDCGAYNITPESCTGPVQTNQSPYWDDVRIGIGPSANAPPLILWAIYQDCYPTENSLLPEATARMFSSYIGSTTGDSALVRTSSVMPDVEVHLNFRVYPGPMTNMSDPFFTDGCVEGDPLAPNWATARLDTAENPSVPRPEGYYATYYHEDDPCFSGPPDGGPDNKVLPDDVFTPGTTIEYFFTSNFTGSPEQNMAPDTTAFGVLHVQVLPGYFEKNGELLAPCVLFSNEFPAPYSGSAQIPIEEFGLRPYLGTAPGDDGRDYDAWDRFDDWSSASLARRPELGNGMTKYQSMIYRWIIHNQDVRSWGLTDWDADLFRHFLTSDDLGRPGIHKGLWLSGNKVAIGLDKPYKPNGQSLLANICGAMVGHGGRSYREVTGDSTRCVRLDPAATPDFPPAGDSYGSVRGNGCPTLYDFGLIETTGGSSRGNQVYVDQDHGQTRTPYASISNDQFYPLNAQNYRVVLDAYSLHLLRSTPDGWTGADCGLDTMAVTRRTSDVLSWLDVPGGGLALCSPDSVIIGVDEGAPSTTPARTLLFRTAPNPFNPMTTVRYQLAKKARVTLRVFDIGGRAVRTLVDGVQEAGVYGAVWDGTTDTGTAVGNGVYWVRMSTSRGFVATTKMVVLR